MQFFFERSFETLRLKGFDFEVLLYIRWTCASLFLREVPTIEHQTSWEMSDVMGSFYSNPENTDMCEFV